MTATVKNTGEQTAHNVRIRIPEATLYELCRITFK